MSARYDAADIEVLTGLEPVRKRPGMYTDTARPNHLVQEVVDNSVDEAIAGHCSLIEVTLCKDGSVIVSDNGRGMPVDEHPGEKISGVEVILTRLHAGGKFSRKNYKFSGGLHGVGVSVVNALSEVLEITVKRGGREHSMSFRNGNVHKQLKARAKVGARNTGTCIQFWPDPTYFDTTKLNLAKLKHVLRAKAVLCPGLRVRLDDQENREKVEWCYEDGLRGYLTNAMSGAELVPVDAFMGEADNKTESVQWALHWCPDDGELVTESYVNLVPTAQGGTHVGGLRQGLLEAMREFC
ncbi:MAG: ATP-binding protein, partial [Gammaproteobacteria bacterium]